MFRQWLFFNLVYFFGHPRWDTGISPPELMEFIASRLPGRALDLGCGTGLNVLTLAKAGWEVLGVDYAWRAIALAKRRLKRAGVHNAEVRIGDVTALSGIAVPYDLVLDIGCSHTLSLAGRDVLRKNLLCWLKPGGTYLLYAHLAQQEGIGITEQDIKALAAFLRLVRRQDGSEVDKRPSVWLWFERP